MSENGPMVMPKGARPGREAISAIASRCAPWRERNAAPSRLPGPVDVGLGGRRLEVECVDLCDLGPEPVHEVGLLEPEVHQRDGEKGG